MSDEIVTVRPAADVQSKQGLAYFVGISEKTAGAKGLSMNLVVVPPGAAAEPHVHKGFETAIFVLEGHVKTTYGPHLSHESINGPGDFVYIPPNVPHQAVNMSQTEPARAIIARNDCNEQESVVLYDPETDQLL